MNVEENKEDLNENEAKTVEKDTVNDGKQAETTELETDKIIKEQEEKLRTLEDKYLRLYSEFDNYKRRTSKEKLEMVESASADVLKAVVPVIDDFERAIKHAEETEKEDEGVKLIYNKLISTLQRKGLEKIPSSIGKDMDVNLHEAITKIPAPKKKLKGKIIDEVECGYKLNGKVIRFAKVVIGE